MPRGDRTGPWGMGPMTGRTSGYCSGYDNPIPGRGYRTDLGRGRNFWDGSGCGRRFMNRVGRFFDGMPLNRNDIAVFPAPDPEAEKEFLRTQTEVLQSQLDKIKNRLDELTAHEAPKV